MKKSVTIAILCGILTAISVICTLDNTQAAVSRGVIRLHIRANSNSPEDQELKIKVRESLLSGTESFLGNVQSPEEARVQMAANLDVMQTIVRDEVEKNGFDYPVRVSLGRSTFPTRAYGDLYLPAGTYEALVVDIGSGEGNNWWCVMFPPLCFVEGTWEEIPGRSEDMMIQSMGEDTYAIVSGRKPRIKFRLYEWWKEISKATE